MSCCGGSATAAHQLMAETPTPRRQAVAPQPVESLVEFEYTGTTRLVVRGPLTSVRYDFPAPHARLLVDGRDASYFTGVPHLKRT